MSVSEPSFMSLSNPEDQKKLFNVVRECSNSLTRIQGEREYIKEAIGSICKELNLSKLLVNKIVRTYFKQNYDEEIATSEEFQQLYETVVK